MIGLDTNVLVRYLVQDDPVQAQTAAAFIEEALASETPLYVNTIVLCETLWVLRSAYGHSEAMLRTVVDKLLHAHDTILEDETVLHQVLQTSERTGVPVVDVLIGKRNQAAGCEATVTFDAKTAASDAFQLL